MLNMNNTSTTRKRVSPTGNKPASRQWQSVNRLTRLRVVLVLLLLALLTTTSVAQEFTFKYRPSPTDNPVRGLVPYVSAMPWCDPDFDEEEKAEYLKEFNASVFPHSIEFHYFSMRELMPEEGRVDFAPIEKWLYQANSRGCQLTFRVYLEYPTHKSPDVPQFLIDNGLKITKWKNDDKELLHAPDYTNPQLREAIDFLIAKLGEKYDGDPRVACLTMGILGHWGEWHSYPRTKLFPKKKYQTHVMDQFAKAFEKTPILMRYPAGDDDWAHAPNANSPFGYHDDSFAYATVDTGKEEDSWYYMAALQAAGATEAWKTRMIGGEIRPEVWGCIFDDDSCEIEGQEFDACVAATHVTWLMDSGMFGENGKPSSERIRNAKKKIAAMGYEFFLSSATVRGKDGKTIVELNIENRGVALFYADWPVEIAVLDSDQNVRKSVSGPCGLNSIMPGKSERKTATVKTALKAGESVAVRVLNPMEGGKPLRFANENQQTDGDAWMILK